MRVSKKSAIIIIAASAMYWWAFWYAGDSETSIGTLVATAMLVSIPAVLVSAYRLMTARAGNYRQRKGLASVFITGSLTGMAMWFSMRAAHIGCDTRCVPSIPSYEVGDVAAQCVGVAWMAIMAGVNFYAGRRVRR